LCPPAGTGDITRIVSRVMALALVGLWGWTVVNRTLGGG